MPRKNANVSLSSYDDIFGPEETYERVQEIPLEELHPFKNHPFKVIDDEAMLRTVESVARYGVLAPAIARPRVEGGYELVAGHRRHHAIKKDRSVDPPKYLVFFKARDSDALTSAFRDYSAATLQKQKKPSVLAQLKKFKALVKSIPDKVRNKDKEQSR